MTHTYLGDNLYLLRKERGISQDEFAEKLGVSRQAVSKWERNDAYPDTENLIAISRFYNISIDDLINKSLDLTSTVPTEIVSVNKSQEPEKNGSESDAEPNKNKDGNKHSENSNTYRLWYSIPYSIVITVAYLLWGFLAPRGWEIGWTLYVTIPIYYSVIECIQHKRFSSFAYPVLVTFIFLLFGMIYHIWHPLWVIFLTVPIYYPIATAIDRAIRQR